MLYMLLVIDRQMFDVFVFFLFFFFSSRRRHTRYIGDWSSDVCSSDLPSFCPKISTASNPAIVLVVYFAASCVTVTHIFTCLQPLVLLFNLMVQL